MAGIPRPAGEDLLQSGILSDFVLKIGDNEIKAHRCILAAASGYFKALFRSNFKEAQDRAVDLSEHDYEAVQRMLHFIYTGSVEVTPQSADNSDSDKGGADSTAEKTEDQIRVDQIERIKKDVLLYQTGDFFAIPPLQEKILIRVKGFPVSSLVPHSNFTTLLEQIYESTRSEDTALRPYITDKCFRVYHTSNTALENGVPDIVAKHEPIAWKIAVTARWEIKNSNCSIELLHESIEKLRAQEKHKDNGIKRLETEIDRWKLQDKQQKDLIQQLRQAMAGIRGW